MSKRSALLALVAIVLAVLPTTPARAEEPTWVFDGGGWGHGVGMSQYGAYGMALEGASAAEILDHYYSGAYLDVLANRSLPSWWTAPYPVKVGLEQSVETVTLSAVHGPVDLCQGDCNEPFTIPAYDAWSVEVVGDSCEIRDSNGAVVSDGSCAIAVSWVDDGTRVKVAGVEYAHGSIALVDSGTGVFDIVLEVALEEYLRGIAEIPGSWSVAAQEAQAIAARNYVVRKVIDRGEDGMSRCGGCHVYDTVLDQVYAGWTKEGISPNLWIDAVEATEGTVAVHPSTGLVFATYYSSSTGGETENNEDVWNGTPLGYLRSVDDHWSVIPEVNNPNATWSVTFSQSQLEALLGWDVVLDARLVSGPAGATVEVVGVNDDESVVDTFRGERLRLTFGLKSPYVSDVVSPFGFADARLSVHEENITYISDLGITRGCNPPDNDMFCPDDFVTRGQMAAFLNRALHLPEATQDYFSDDDDSTFEDDINRVAEAGITRGCDEGRYCPDRPVTREQMAAFLVRGFGYEEVGDVKFTDDDESIFETDIEKLAAAGVTQGCGDDRYCPAENVTRAQMASFLARALRLIESQG